MTTELMLAAAAANDPSRDPWVLVGVPVAVALITGLLTGGAGIAVALLTSKRQAGIAAADRAAANEREQLSRDAADEREQRARDAVRHQASLDRADQLRQRREDVHESITAAISEHAGAYANVIRQAKQMDSHAGQLVARPPRAQLVRTLSQLVNRLGEQELYSDVIGMLAAGDRYVSITDSPKVLGILQERLDFWFLGRRDTTETRRHLRADAEGMAVGVLPTEAMPEALPDQ